MSKLPRLRRIGYIEGEDRVPDYDPSPIEPATERKPGRVRADVHALSFAQMGIADSEKVPLTSCCRRTPDGREWVVVGKSWKLLADLDNDGADWRDKHTRF